MVNSTNKVRLQKLVLKHMNTRVAQLPCGVLYCEGERVTNLNTDMAVGDYGFKHLVGDTILLLIYAKLMTTNYTNTAVLDSEDTDAYVQAAYVSNQIQGELLIKRKQALVNCHTMLPDDVSNVIVPLHVLTGSDHTSGYYGKKPPLQKLMKDPEARELLGRVGESLELKDEVKADMKAFILSKDYGEDIALTYGQARASKWQKLKKKSTVRLPPDDDTPNHHCTRQNRITYYQLHFTFVAHPTPIGHGWEIINANVNQCATRCHHCPTRSWLLNICSIAVMRAEVIMTVGQESQQIKMSNMHNLKFKDQNYALSWNWQQIAIVWSKYPKNHKNGQFCGTKVCTAHLQHDDHLAFEGLNRV